MSQTLALDNNFLKEVFRPLLKNQIRNGSPFSEKITRMGKKLTLAGQSLTVRWSNMTALAWRGAALSEGGDFAPSGYIAAGQNTLGATHRSFTYKYTGHAAVAGTKKEAAYVAKSAGKRLAEAIRKEAVLTRQIFDTNDGTANLGIIAAGGVASNVLTLTSAAQMNRFYEGMHVDVRSAATSGTERISTVANGRILEIDHLARTITLTNATGAQAGDYVALRGYYDQTLPAGIQNLVSTTVDETLQGVDRTTAGNGWMRNLKISGGGAALTNDLVQQAVDHVAQRGANSQFPDTICCTHKVRRWFNLIQEGDRRYGNVHEPTAGIKSATFHTGEKELEIMPDKFMPQDKIYMLKMSEWGRAAPEGAQGGDWATENGNVLRRATAASGAGYADALEATWVERDNTFVDDMSSQLVLSDFISPA